MPFAIQPARLFALSLGLAALLGASAIPATSATPAVSGCFETSAVRPKSDVRAFIKVHCMDMFNHRPESGVVCYNSTTVQRLHWRLETCPVPKIDECVDRFNGVLLPCSGPTGDSSTRGGWEIKGDCKTVIDPNAGNCK